MSQVLLLVLSGRPGSGKTTLGRAVADRLGATFLRVDSVEVAIGRCGLDVAGNPAGYAVAHAVAADQLRSGRPVVVDAVNPVEEARAGWTELAADQGARLRHVEVVCGDPVEHRRRVERRRPDLPGQMVPSWSDVATRSYPPWRQPRLVVDNRGDPADGVMRILAYCAD